jgi:hypothetical protein
MQVAQSSRPLSKRSEIVKLLTKFSLRRGAAVTPEILALYADDLSTFELDDIDEALERFGKATVEQFEAAFPCIGVFLAKVGSVANTRKRAERERVEKLEEQERSRLAEEDFRLNPEKYLAQEREFQKKVDALNGKFGVVESKPKPN